MCIMQGQLRGSPGRSLIQDFRLDYNIDHAGPMTKNVMDNALLLSVIAGDDGIDDRQGPGVPLKGQTPEYHKILEANAAKGVSGMKIGILTEAFE
jgi:amidase